MFWSKKSDETTVLIAGCLENNRRSQEQLYSLYFKDFYRHLEKWLKEEDDILTVLNESFLKIFLNLSKLQNPLAFNSWSKTILHNECMDFLKARNKIKESELILEVVEPMRTEEHAQFIQDDFNKLLAQLPKTTREVFVQFALEGYPHAEIAKKMNMTENTSRWHVNNARKILQDRWYKLANI